jgi:phosphoenolpyruvate synthase/pyruvate phosphate dikinase
VSALVDPDTVIIHRNSGNSLKINTTIIGKKSQKISMKTNGCGTDTLKVSTEEMSKLSITLDEALKLAEIALILDQLYNAPRDIEWALFQGQLYLLQCRPVTSLNTWTDFELIHELGNTLFLNIIIFRY